MMPVVGWSMAIRKPLSSQKSRTAPQTFSGGRSTRSQRSSPLRMKCTSAMVLGAVVEVAVDAAAWLA